MFVHCHYCQLEYLPKACRKFVLSEIEVAYVCRHDPTCMRKHLAYVRLSKYEVVDTAALDLPRAPIVEKKRGLTVTIPYFLIQEIPSGIKLSWLVLQGMKKQADGLVIMSIEALDALYAQKPKGESRKTRFPLSLPEAAIDALDRMDSNRSRAIVRVLKSYLDFRKSRDIYE